MGSIRIKRLVKRSLIISLVYLIFTVIGLSIGFEENQIKTEYGKDITLYEILMNNAQALTVNMLGVLTLGISTLINLSINGIMHGLAIRHYFDLNSLEKTLLCVLPHGIFEIPCIVISGVVGITPLFLIFDWISKKKIEIKLKEIFVDILIMVLFSFLLMFVAACIEINLIGYLKTR